MAPARTRTSRRIRSSSSNIRCWTWRRCWGRQTSPHCCAPTEVRSATTRARALLRRHGGGAGTIPLSHDQEFLAACMRLDRAAAQRIAAEHPELLRSHKAMFEAAKRDRPDVMALLLDLGVPLEIEDRSKARALHHAAAANALRAARFLIARGGTLD